MYPFRISTPTRNCTRVFLKYRSYKKWLVKDFNNRCGYCDGSDTWHGGHRSYHIDHFAPKDKFPQLATTYTNLVYACASCNGAKSNKWPSNNPTVSNVNDKGFLDPVNNDLNDHFRRDENGNILATTDIAKDMVLNLNLHLERHSIIWMLTKLEELIKKNKISLDGDAMTDDVRKTLEGLQHKVLRIFFEYIQKFKIANN